MLYSFDQKYSKTANSKISNSNLVMHYYKSRKQNNKKKHNCFPVIVKLNFQQSVLQSSVSHDTSEIIL